MSTQNGILDLSYKAAEDLSSDKYRFIVIDSSTGLARRPNNASEKVRGILQNAPVAGEAAVVRLAGVSKFEANDALTINTFIKPEFVSASDAGKGQDAAGAMEYAAGIVVEETDAEDDLGSVLLFTPSPTRQYASVAIPDLTANTTGRVGLLAVQQALKVTKISIASYNKPADADGVITLAITNYDQSATADDNLLVAATFDLESLTAKESEKLALTATAADLILAANDFIFADFVNDSAAIDTNLGGAVIVIEYDLL
jgi:hypothetical protein